MTMTAVVAKYATAQIEKDRLIERQIDYYNLDLIISVGYRIKSKRGIQFRQWATGVLRDYLLKGYAVNQRIQQLEYRVAQNEKKIDFFVKTALPPTEGVFFNGQIFDAYTFAADLVKSAKKTLTLVDNYVDETTLLLLAKRNDNVIATVYTHSISKQLQNDIQKHNAQYPIINVITFKHAHDRFLLVDDTVYHVGASLKDLGKKWFAFSKMTMNGKKLLDMLEK
jgi:hypothetical protein